MLHRERSDYLQENNFQIQFIGSMPEYVSNLMHLGTLTGREALKVLLDR